MNPWSWDFYFHPDYTAPYRSNDLKEACVLAYDYFSIILDDFVQQLPKGRQPLEFADWLAGEPTLAERVQLIFPNGFGEYDEEKNLNPHVWPVFLGLSEAVLEGESEAFADELCESWDNFNADGECKDQMQLLQRIFDYFTAYLQLFVVLQDAASIDLDFKYPPEDKCGILLGSAFRKLTL